MSWVQQTSPAPVLKVMSQVKYFNLSARSRSSCPIVQFDKSKY